MIRINLGPARLPPPPTGRVAALPSPDCPFATRLRHCPSRVAAPGPSEIEIRPVYDMADFGDALTPEVAALHDRIRAKAASR